MADPIPVNPDLPTSYQVPGTYVYLSRVGSAPLADNRRILLLGYKTSAGSASAGDLKRINSVDDAVAFFGKGSDLTRQYRALLSQLSGGSGAQIFGMPMTAPSGTAQTRTIKVLQAPVGGALGTGNTGAVAAGIWTLWICGYRFDCQIANGDTYATIAANMLAQILTLQDFLPCTAAVSTDTITLTARHAALTSADLPIMSAFSSASMALAASPGTLTIATTASGAGSFTLYVARQSVSTSIADTDAPTAIAAAAIVSINAASAFPVTAAQTGASAVVTLFFVDGRVFNWAATTITTTLGTTVTPAWGASAAGLPSSASPSLATVLTNLSTQEAFRLWVTNFTGAGSYITTSGLTATGSATDYSVMGTISSYIEQYANGLYGKGQMVVFTSTQALATAGALTSATTPALNLSPRYFMTWCPASPQQAVEIAARVAGLIAQNLDYPNHNYAGGVLLTDSQTPLLLPALPDRPSDSDVNSAMLSYNMAPLRASSQNQLAVVSGRTTAKPSAILGSEYVFWGTALADDFIRDDLAVQMPQLIAGKNLKVYGTVRTQNTLSPEAIRVKAFSRMQFYDSLDIFDGADDLRQALGVQVNQVLPSRIDVKLPKRFALPAEQISIVAQYAS